MAATLARPRKNTVIIHGFADYSPQTAVFPPTTPSVVYRSNRYRRHEVFPCIRTIYLYQNVMFGAPRGALPYSEHKLRNPQGVGYIGRGGYSEKMLEGKAPPGRYRIQCFGGDTRLRGRVIGDDATGARQTPATVFLFVYSTGLFH